MGIFKDFATSAAGDLTIGAFEGLEAAAQKDVVVNATSSNNALTRENEAYNITEQAFKNKAEIANILAANPDAFGLTNQEGLSIEQVADRFSNYMFLENRSIFEDKDMNKVKLNVAKFMAQEPGKGFTIYDPYISGEDRFKQEQELHQARISEITKMPKADKLLMKLQKAEEGVATPESITDELTKVTALTAKGYGILNTYPTSEAGRKNLEFVQVNLITANAKAQFPDDAGARAQFINERLYNNNIDPTDGIMYANNMNYKIMSDVISAQGGAIANQMLELTNRIAAAKNDDERRQLNDQLNQIVLEQHKTMDTYSKSAGTLMAGQNRSDIFPSEKETGAVPLPLAAEGYVPTINKEGDLVIDLANGNRQTLPLEVLNDSPESIKLLPIEAQNYINTIKNTLFVDGEMVKPTRQMFEDGAAGDKAFRDFLGIYNSLNIEDRDMSLEGTGVSDMDPLSEKEKIRKDFEKEKASFKDADITKLKKDTQTGDDIKIEELAPANTVIPKKKPDQPDQPKEKSLSDKIQEDFPNANVGISGGDVNVEEGTKKKTDTQTQTEDVFEGSGVEPMFQSARFKFRNIDQGYLVDQWSSNYQTEGSMIKRLKANKDLILGSNNAIPADAAKQIDLVASAFDGDNNFSKDQITEILGAIGFIESDGYKYKKQGLNRIDDGKGVARSYWQVEPSTAESILDENLNVMKGGGNPFLGANFEKLFRSKYADQIGSGTALEYFAKLNRKELSDLLLKDGLFAASMAAHKVVTTFDPFNSKGA